CYSICAEDSGEARLASRSGAGSNALWLVYRRWGDAAQQPLLRAPTNGHAQAVQAVLAPPTGEPFGHFDRYGDVPAGARLPSSGIRPDSSTRDPCPALPNERRANAHPGANAVAGRVPDAVGD